MIPLWLVACQLMNTELSAEDAAPLVPVPVCQYDFGPEDDRDLNGAPDEWVRRKGPAFPRYVKAGLDRTFGRRDSASLRIQANGGAAAYYSPFVRIDSLHTFHFEGYIRTQGLKHDAAMLSISLLNHRRQRVQRILSRPVLGDQDEWIPVRLGPIAPDADVRFAVIGCHLVPGSGDQHDIGGNAWFDDLSLGRLPRLELESNFLAHFLNEAAPIRITTRISGLDDGYNYQLELGLRDRADKIVAETTQQLTVRHVAPLSGDTTLPEPLVWESPRQPPGFYRVKAVLKRDGMPITTQQTTLTVLKLVANTRRSGEFGWSLEQDLPRKLRDELPQVSAQAGVNWLKYPLWRSLEDSQATAQAGNVATLFDHLRTQGVEPIGVLADPPAKLRSKFARQWLGVAEVFRLSPTLWRDSLEPVVARFSSNVHHWQVGGDLDTSFLGIPDLPATMQTVRAEIQKISLNAGVGLPWTAAEPIPETVRPTFWSVAATADQILAGIPDARRGASSRWLLLQTAQLSGQTVEERGGELARQMVAAKISGAPAIFVSDVYHPQHGLLTPNGSPSELFLPWRTYALMLQGAEYLGALPLPNGSHNAVFTRDGEAIAVLWNDVETTETIYLGEAPQEMDLWGRTRPLVTVESTGEQLLEAGPIPKLIVDCSAPVARWRIAAGFQAGKMRSEYGGHKDTIIGINTFPQGVSGTVTLILPPEWESDQREWPIHAGVGEPFRCDVYLTAPPNAPLGEHAMFLDFNIVADRKYHFRIPKSYTVGLGDVTLEVRDRKLPDGRLEIEQTVSNRTEPEEILDFRCSLFVPDSRRQKLQITKLGQGQDRKLYHLPNAERYRGQTMSLRLEQDGGRRVLNYRWKVGEEW